MQGIYDEDVHYANHVCTNNTDCEAIKFSPSQNGLIAERVTFIHESCTNNDAIAARVLAGSVRSSRGGQLRRRLKTMPVSSQDTTI